MKPSVDHLRSSVLARRYNVVALAFVLCAWLVAAAMHLHVADKDKEAGAAEPQYCSYCLAFSGGVAPPPQHQLPEAAAAPVAVAVSYDLPAAVRKATSFYLSRGPPAI